MSWLKKEDINRETLEEFHKKAEGIRTNYAISAMDTIIDTERLPLFIKGDYIDFSTASDYRSSGSVTGDPISRRNPNVSNAKANQNENKEDSDSDSSPDDSLPLSELRQRSIQ